jgi:hypothetical protein
MLIDHNAIHSKINDLQTIEEKRELVSTTNPLMYAFGYTLTPRNGMDYADWLEKLELARWAK